MNDIYGVYARSFAVMPERLSIWQLPGAEHSSWFASANQLECVERVTGADNHILVAI
jgi:hypothetical protein